MLPKKPAAACNLKIGPSLPEAERRSKKLNLDNRHYKALREYTNYMHENPLLRKPPSPRVTPLQPHPVCGNCTHPLCTKWPPRDE
ncbi:hypothetical protein OROHE_022897 [Orobanche hederae]